MVEALENKISAEILKYTATKHFKLLEWVEMGSFEIVLVKSKANVAYILTKADDQFQVLLPLILQSQGNVSGGSAHGSAHGSAQRGKNSRAQEHEKVLDLPRISCTLLLIQVHVTSGRI